MDKCQGQMVTDRCRYRNQATHQIHFQAYKMNLYAYFTPCHPRSLPYSRGYCPFLAFFFFIAQGFSCSTSSTKRFGGRDCHFARAATLNFGHIEQAQLCHLHVRVTNIKCPTLWGMTLIDCCVATLVCFVSLFKFFMKREGIFLMLRSGTASWVLTESFEEF